MTRDPNTYAGGMIRLDDLTDPNSDATAALKAAYAANVRLLSVDQYGADPTGATDSTAAFRAAQTAGGSNPYRLVLSAGTYKLGTSADLLTFGRKQGIQGQGSDVTTINYVGAATCINALDASFGGNSVAGQFRGLTIDGTGAGASAVGLSLGNLATARGHDVIVQNFTGASAVGFQFKNSGGWSEQAEWTACKSANNTVGVLFDNNSFDYSLYQFLFITNANQDGIRLQNNAALEGVRLEVRGNFYTGATNTGAVIAIDRGNAAGSSRIDFAQLYINVECDGSTGVGHYTTLMNGGSSSQFTGQGVVQFSDETIAFQGAVNTNGATFGIGGSYSDHTAGKPANGDALVVHGGSQWAQRGSFTFNNLNVYLNVADVQAAQLSSGSNALTFYGLGSGRARRVELFLVQPTSGAAGTITWPANVYFPGGAPTLSTANGAVDKVVLTYLPTEGKWFGQWFGNYVQASSLVAPPAYQPYLGLEGEAIAAGDETQLRRFAGSGVTPASGTLHLSFFNSRKTETKTKIAALPSGTAAAGLTYAAMGIYSVAGNGALTLLGQCASDTTLFNATFSVTAGTRSLTAGVATTQGQRYAFGLLLVGTTMPVLYGANNVFALNNTYPPIIAATMTGQSSLPASVASGGYTASGTDLYGWMYP